MFFVWKMGRRSVDCWAGGRSVDSGMPAMRLTMGGKGGVQPFNARHGGQPWRDKFGSIKMETAPKIVGSTKTQGPGFARFLRLLVERSRSLIFVSEQIKRKRETHQVILTRATFRV